MSKRTCSASSGPIATGDAKLYVDGFVAGAKAADPYDHGHPVYTGSFSDDSLMATAAKTFVSDGADVLTGSSQSVVGAIGVAKPTTSPGSARSGARRAWPRSNVVAAQVYNWTPILQQISPRSGPASSAARPT